MIPDRSARIPYVDKMKRIEKSGKVEAPLRCVAVLGPTATGKTKLGVHLARLFDGEIVSVDSRQVYRGMDIGTGKDLQEYGEGVDAVRTHLIDCVEPTDEYNLHRFTADAARALRAIAAHQKLPFLVGGTPLYLNALLMQYEMPGGAPDPVLRDRLTEKSTPELLDRLRTGAPDLFERIDKSQRKRIIRAVEIAETRTGRAQEIAATVPPLKPVVLGVYYERREVHRRIEERLDRRLKSGLIEEVARLHEEGVSWERLEFLGLEYRYASYFLQGRITAEDLRETLLRRIRRFCKSQDVWFRKMERDGIVIHWIPHGDRVQAAKLVKRFLDDEPLPAPEIRLSRIHYGPRSG